MKPATPRLNHPEEAIAEAFDHDLAGIQRKADERGVPVQTPISSLIHQFVDGQIAFRLDG
jgi:hypothetical protein